jgi:hypothetical protein
MQNATRSIPPPPPPRRSSRPEAPRTNELLDVADFVDELDLASREGTRTASADDSIEELDPELDLLEEEGEPS